MGAFGAGRSYRRAPRSAHGAADAGAFCDF